MLVQRALRATGFGRRDAARFATSLTILVLILTAILGADILPERVSVQAGDIAGSDIRAPKTADFESGIQTDAARQEARAAVPPQYDYTTARGANVATAQARALADRVAPVEAAFAASNLTAAQRKSVLQAAIPELGKDDRTTLASLTRDRWKAVRDEAARVLDDVERAELRDTQVADVRATLEGRIEGDLTRAERSLATALIAPLVVPNSSYSLERTQQQQEKAAEAVPAVREHVAQGETLVRAGDQVTALDVEKIQRLGLDVTGPDFTRLAGWF